MDSHLLMIVAFTLGVALRPSSTPPVSLPLVGRVKLTDWHLNSICLDFPSTGCSLLSLLHYQGIWCPHRAEELICRGLIIYYLLFTRVIMFGLTVCPHRIQLIECKWTTTHGGHPLPLDATLAPGDGTQVIYAEYLRVEGVSNGPLIGLTSSSPCEGDSCSVIKRGLSSP